MPNELSNAPGAVNNIIVDSFSSSLIEFSLHLIDVYFSSNFCKYISIPAVTRNTFYSRSCVISQIVASEVSIRRSSAAAGRSDQRTTGFYLIFLKKEPVVLDRLSHHSLSRQLASTIDSSRYFSPLLFGKVLAYFSRVIRYNYRLIFLPVFFKIFLPSHFLFSISMAVASPGG